jgi:hypothetical protein
LISSVELVGWFLATEYLLGLQSLWTLIKIVKPLSKNCYLCFRFKFIDSIWNIQVTNNYTSITHSSIYYSILLTQVDAYELCVLAQWVIYRLFTIQGRQMVLCNTKWYCKHIYLFVCVCGGVIKSYNLKYIN